MRKIIVTLVVLLFAIPAASKAQSTDLSWLDDLKDQLAYEKQCEVAYLLNMKEGMVGGQSTYEARVKCADGRMFDASRIGKAGVFKFEACETQTC